MADSSKTNFYRIGEYAQKMGVTPDFLKYYEQQGILRSHTLENGYHYYPFNQSSKILECMRLKNYGFSVRSIDALFRDDAAAAQEKMAQQVRELEAKVAFEQQVIREHRNFSRWLDRMDGRSSDWCIDWGDEMLFLPHTNRRTFLEDPRIYEILKDWTKNMPMVKSCMEIPAPWPGASFDLETNPFYWGMSVTKACAQEIGLPVNGAVKHLHRRKLFQFHFNNLRSPGSAFPLAAAAKQMEALGLTPRGSCYITVFMSANIKNSPQRCGILSVPID